MMLTSAGLYGKHFYLLSHPSGLGWTVYRHTLSAYLCLLLTPCPVLLEEDLTHEVGLTVYFLQFLLSL